MVKETTACIIKLYPKYQRTRPNLTFIIPVILIFPSSKSAVVHF